MVVMSSVRRVFRELVVRVKFRVMAAISDS